MSCYSPHDELQFTGQKKYRVQKYKVLEMTHNSYTACSIFSITSYTHSVTGRLEIVLVVIMVKKVVQSHETGMVMCVLGVGIRNIIKFCLFFHCLKMEKVSKMISFSILSWQEFFVLSYSFRVCFREWIFRSFHFLSLSFICNNDRAVKYTPRVMDREIKASQNYFFYPQREYFFKLWYS